MTWEPSPRPAWVAAINRGRWPEPGDAIPSHIDAARDDLLAANGRPLPLVQGDAPLGFAVFAEAIEAHANLTVLGRWATVRYLDRLAAGRADIAGLKRTDPSIFARPVVEPVFVIGAPRTGTTVMHRLLAQVPGHRAPEGWELLRPAPPPQPDTFDSDPRIAEAGSELVFPQAVAGSLNAIHQYSARMPKECLSAMSFSGLTEEFISRYDVPSYVEWLGAQSMAPAYDTHHEVLQILQHQMPDQRWILKSPVHLQAMPELVARYPDARFVITHRDPTDVLASVTSLVCTLRSAFSDRVDAYAVGRYHLQLYSRSLDDLVDHVDRDVLPADRTVHVHHRDVVRNAPAELARVSNALGLPLDEGTLSSISESHAEPRADSVGEHRYDAADFGLDHIDRDGLFGRYLERFEVLS